MTELFKYDAIFNDHMDIARKRFMAKYEREPTVDELIVEYQKLINYFYD